MMAGRCIECGKAWDGTGQPCPSCATKPKPPTYKELQADNAKLRERVEELARRCRVGQRLLAEAHGCSLCEAYILIEEATNDH